MPVVAIILSLAAAIAVCICVLPEKRRNSLPTWAQVLADILNFKHILTEYVLRFAYIFITIFCIIGGLVLACGRYTTAMGLSMMFLGPIIVRLIFEAAMLWFLLVKNVIEINQKTPGKVKKGESLGDALKAAGKDIQTTAKEAEAKWKAEQAAKAAEASAENEAPAPVPETPGEAAPEDPVATKEPEASTDI